MPRAASFLLLILLCAGCVSLDDRSRASLPHVAHAWAVFDRDNIVEHGAWGLADPRSGRMLDIDDPVRIASVSKLVVALGALRMAEAGTLDLDADVSEYLGWTLRHPRFPGQPISLRMLLSHRSSLTDEVDYAIPLGSDLRSTLPDPAAFDPGHAPGTYFRYANLNFPVVASVMEKASGERFDALMERLVLRPLAIDACFNWTTCSDDAVANAVVLTEPDGTPVRDDLRGRRPDCPVLGPPNCDLSGYVPGSNGALFSPQGGLRISARGLATIGQVLLNEGRHEEGRFLSPESMTRLAVAEWRFDGGNGITDHGFYCAYGLAVQLLPVNVKGCREDLFGGRHVLGHAGEAYGLRSGLWIDRASGKGIAYFATGNGEDPPSGRRTAYRAIEEFLAGRLAL